MSAESTNALIAAESASRPKPTLRERKKERTRRTIRTEAFRLFREQGYNETTVEQIAEAAEISPSTFFRYFPSKEQVVLADDLDPYMFRAIDRQPPGMPLLAAIRQATLDALAEVSEEEFDFERERMALIRAVPELRGVIARELERNTQIMVEIGARYTGRATDDFELRAFAGAITGAMFVLMDDDPYGEGQITRVLDFLAAGLPI
ncbi:TetR family transcriptional regulator [Nocardia inohanensis]|uniref:TetR family transcriptional regulator n=1 Tax=Nocardia inohanensis TaxID=209246 RepID=UPI0008342191|nr:TetR family transcriptional regulator [Nocardia inohanensis]